MKKSRLYLPTLFTELMREDPADNQRAMLAAVMCYLEYDPGSTDKKELQEFWGCIQRYPAVMLMDLPLVDDARKTAVDLLG